MASKPASFIFSLFCVCIVAAKLLRFYINSHSFPILVFILCLPAFFTPEALLISIQWWLLRPRQQAVLSGLALGVALFASAVTLLGATAQINFFWQSGGELAWADAGAFASDSGGRQVLLSEGRNAAIISGVLIAISWAVKRFLFNFIGAVVVIVSDRVWSVSRTVLSKVRHRSGSEYEGKDEESADYGLLDPNSEDGTIIQTHLGGRIQRILWLVYGASLLVLLASPFFFDSDLPYGRVLTAIPIFEMFRSKKTTSDSTCSSWPYPNLIVESMWETPYGDYKGWAPGDDDNDYIRAYRERKPAWLPETLPSGFARWEEHELPDMTGNDTWTGDDTCRGTAYADPYYNPVNDPMRISNLDNDILNPLKSALDLGGVDIRHIVLVEMESMREELFPLQQGSPFHGVLMKHTSGSSTDDIDAANAKFSRLTPNFEKITGKPGNFAKANGEKFEEPADADVVWTPKTMPGFGGINVVGAHTAGSITTKSSGVINCGTGPLPVNMFEESELDFYQPCFTQILQLFNAMKDESKADLNTASDDYREDTWNPAFFQSITDSYDRQDIFNEKIGFNISITDNQIRKDHPGLEEVNYFGFAEPVLKEYIKDYITEATSNNQRMFMNHFTSTTHHPWGTPSEFDTEVYTARKKDMNKYLNTIRFTDTWLGEMMQVLEDLNVANQTLVVFVGDHGQAFEEDFSKTGTYQNPHVSNFRVPITFYHPSLPQYQYHAGATSISILPTMLDLLVASGSLNKRDAEAASDLVQDYEGQSLLREYKTNYHGRRAWNFGVVNPGGETLIVTSADTSFRLAMPWDKSSEFFFSDLEKDVIELDRITSWSMATLKSAVKRKHGDEAFVWLEEAESVAHWWAKERRRLWQYTGDED